MAQEHAELCAELDAASQDKHVPRLHAAISAWSFHPEDDMYKTCRQHLANVWEEYKRSAARLKELSRICASDLENVSDEVENELEGLLQSWPFSLDDRVYDRAYRIIMRLRGEEPEDEEVEALSAEPSDDGSLVWPEELEMPEEAESSIRSRRSQRSPRDLASPAPELSGEPAPGPKPAELPEQAEGPARQAANGGCMSWIRNRSGGRVGAGFGTGIHFLYLHVDYVIFTYNHDDMHCLSIVFVSPHEWQASLLL